MDLMELVKLAGTMSSLKMGSPVEEFAPILKFLGFPEETGANILKLMQVQATGVEQGFLDFLKSGGLVKVLASPNGPAVNRFQPISCPHCTETIILK